MGEVVSINKFKTKKETFTIELDSFVQASPETIFDVLTDIDGLKDIMGCDIEGEIKVGSPIKFIWEMEEGADCSGINGGEVLALERPKLFSFTWGDEDDGRRLAWASTRVEIKITPEGEGARVSLFHYDLPSDYEADQHMGGWKEYMEIIEAKWAS